MQGAGGLFDEVDHKLDVTKWGLAAVGYQWLTESGLGIDAYMGPMFRGINRTFVMDGYPTKKPATLFASASTALLDVARTGRALQW